MFSMLYIPTAIADLTVSSTILNSQTVSVSLDIDTDSSTIQITMVGPANRWWGIGFGGTTMLNRYAIIADSDDSTVTEYTLARRSQGSALSSSQITICSDSVVSSTRTILLTRALSVSNGYDFSDTAGSLSMIASYGSSSTTYASANTMADRSSTTVQVTESPSSVTICTKAPTVLPTVNPTLMPSMPTLYPSKMPTSMPTVYPTIFPTSLPTVNPSMMPSLQTVIPTFYPSMMPSILTIYPSVIPTVDPTAHSKMPTGVPSMPTVIPTLMPSMSTNDPTVIPTGIPSMMPSVMPTKISVFSSAFRYGGQQWIICCIIVIAFVLNYF